MRVQSNLIVSENGVRGKQIGFLLHKNLCRGWFEQLLLFGEGT